MSERPMTDEAAPLPGFINQWADGRSGPEDSSAWCERHRQRHTLRDLFDEHAATLDDFGRGYRLGWHEHEVADAVRAGTVDVASDERLPKLPSSEVLGSLLHDAVHPRHEWSSCGRPDDVYLWVGRFRADFDLLAHKAQPYNLAATLEPAALDWPTLANIIREVDGNHDLGAGELAERILAHPRYAALSEPTR